MLDRSALSAQLNRLGPTLFSAADPDGPPLTETWQQIAADQTFVDRAHEAESSFLIPTWQGNLADIFPVTKPTESYTVLGVDGSQIYPDRHRGNIDYCVINVGGISIAYDEMNPVAVFSQPELISTQQPNEHGDLERMTPEFVDFLREARELECAAERALELKKNSSRTPFVLIDGSIIFWQLEGSSPYHQKMFLDRYMAALDRLHAAQIPYAGYISFPRSKELVNLIKLGRCRFKVANCIPCHSAYTTFPCRTADSFTDTQLLAPLLPQAHRTIIFGSSSHIINHYPAHQKPHFVYLNVGAEIARIEIPAWLASQADLCDALLGVMLDQADKGNGYPIILAEAHEQAVIKAADKEFFYQTIQAIGLQAQLELTASQKSIKKRRMPY
jgi:hypothetical protein